MASAGRDKVIKIWETSSGWDTLSLKGHKGAILDVSFSRDDSKILSASADSTVKIWDSATGEEISMVKNPLRPRI